MVTNSVEVEEFPSTIHLQFEEGFISSMEAVEISGLFEEYGDFFLHKDTANSVYMEFFFIDPQVEPSGKIAALIEKLLQRQDLKIVQAYDHKQAPKFKAHSNFDAK